MQDWIISPETTEKSSTGYVGLKNLACTCYMNSLLQQLYMIPTFRNDILQVDDPNKKLNPEDNILYQTQCLFSALTESVKQHYNPKIFCHAFKDWDGKSINVMEQMDVDEFFNLFLDKIENAIKGTPQEKSIKYHFGGVYANQLICKDCPHSSLREEPFLAINLQIKNKKSLQQCMESFVEGEMLQGNNAYHCEKCDKKVTTLKRVCIKKLPKHLIFVLKRFDIDYDTMQKFKVNGFCEFPMKLNMEAFTMEGLAKRDKEKEKEKAMKEGRDLDEETQPPQTQPTVQYPPEYYDYKLTGVLIHIGSADAGHYYSLIMDREKTWLPEKERWYEFNDTIVEQYDPSEIRNDAFGGEERFTTYEGTGSKIIEKIRNAYMLVYERANSCEIAEEEEVDKGKVQKVGIKGEAIIPEEIHKAIQAENVKYWYNKYMFDLDYFGFARGLNVKWNSTEFICRAYPSKNCDYNLYNFSEEFKKKHIFQIDPQLSSMIVEPDPEANSTDLQKNDLLVFKYTATILLTTLLRSRNRYFVPDFMDITKAYLNKHVSAAQWLLMQFTNSKIIQEFLFECTEDDSPRLVVGLLYCAMIKTYEIEMSKIGTEEKCVLTQFANCIMNQLAGCRKYTKNFAYYFQVMARLAILGPKMREYLLKNGTITRLIGFWKNLPETNWNDFKSIEYAEIKEVELGTSTEVDERFPSPFEEIFQQRREQICQQAQPVYTFLFETISLLLRATTFTEKPSLSPIAFQKGFTVDPQLKALLMNPKILAEFMSDCRSNLAIDIVTKGFQYLSWENIEFKTAWLKGIILQMNEAEYGDLKGCFQFLVSLLNVEDTGKISFVDLALTELDTMLKNNQQAFYATFYSVDNICNLAVQDKEILNCYKKNPDKIQWLINWLKENPYPPSKPEASGIKPYKSIESNERHYQQARFSFGLDEQNKWKFYTEMYAGRLAKITEGIDSLWNFLGVCPNINSIFSNITHVYYKKFLKGQILEQ